MWAFIYDFVVGQCCCGREKKDIKHLALNEYNELVADIKAIREKSCERVVNISLFVLYTENL